MTLVYNMVISSVTGGSFGSIVTRGSGSEVICGPTPLKRFSLITGLQVGSTINIITNPTSICMLTTNLVASMSFNNTDCAVTDLTTNTVTNITSVGFGIQNKTQNMAGDRTAGIALGLGFSPGTLIRFTSAPTATLLPFRYSGTTPRTLTSIVSMGDGSNSFIIGTNDGRIIQVDTAGVEQLSYNIAEPLYSWQVRDTTIANNRSVWCMHYDSRGFLLVSCLDGYVYLINHLTGTTLQRHKISNLSTTGPILSLDPGISSAIVPTPSGFSYKTHVQDVDIYTTPIKQSSIVVIPQNTFYFSSGIDGSKYWIAGTSPQDIQVLDYTADRTTTNHSISANDGGPVKSDLLVLDDSAGVGLSKVMLKTDIPAAGQTIPATSGVNALFISSYKSGAGEKFCIKRNIT